MNARHVGSFLELSCIFLTMDFPRVLLLLVFVAEASQLYSIAGLQSVYQQLPVLWDGKALFSLREL